MWCGTQEQREHFSKQAMYLIKAKDREIAYHKMMNIQYLFMGLIIGLIISILVVVFT